MSVERREPLQGKRRHKLMPADVRLSLPSLYAQDGKGLDAMAYVKFFSPFGRYTYYVTEFDGVDTLFGYCVSPLGPDCDELGYGSLDEIAQATVFAGVPAIERDCGWTPRTIREALR